MPRTKPRIPWWTQPTESEKRITLEKEHGGPGKTGYGVYFDEERIGYVYSEQRVGGPLIWRARFQGKDLDEVGDFTERFPAMRALVRAAGK